MSNNNIQEHRSNSALKSGFWYTISSISVRAILIITTPIFTRIMTTEEYGLSSTFTTWFILLNVICSLNLWYSIGRAKLDYPGMLDNFVASIQTLAFLFTVIIGIIVFPFMDKICQLFEMDETLVLALFVYLLAYPAVQFTQAKFKYTYKYTGNIAITIYTTVTTVLLSLIFVFLLPNHRALGKSLGAVISALILAIFVWIVSIKRKWVTVNFEYWKYALIISVPLILNSISLNILGQSDRVFITKFNGSHYTGIYSLAYSYAVLINIVLNAVNEAWLPWFHDTFAEGMSETIRKNVKPLVTFGCWFGVGCVAIAPEAIALLGGEAYIEGNWVVPPVALGVVCNYIFQHYEHVELHLKKTWYISAGTIVAALLNILLNYIFIPIYGFVAAAYTTLFCYFLLMIAHNFISRKVLKVHLYEDKFMYLSFALTFVLCGIFMSLYNALWVWRWILIILISVTYLIYNRKLITTVVHTFMRRK